MHFLEQGDHNYPIGAEYSTSGDNFIILYKDEIIESTNYNKWCVRINGATSIFKSKTAAQEHFKNLCETNNMTNLNVTKNNYVQPKN